LARIGQAIPATTNLTPTNTAATSSTTTTPSPSTSASPTVLLSTSLAAPTGQSATAASPTMIQTAQPLATSTSPTGQTAVTGSPLQAGNAALGAQPFNRVAPKKSQGFFTNALNSLKKAFKFK
jgi:hypothetical protein